MRLTEKMIEEIRYAARNEFYGTMAYAGAGTEDALLRQGLITYDHGLKDSDGDWWPYPVLTEEGWKVVAEHVAEGAE